MIKTITHMVATAELEKQVEQELKQTDPKTAEAEKLIEENESKQ